MKGVPNIGVCEKKDISNNKKGTTGKNKKQCKSSLNNKIVFEQVMEFKSPAYIEGNIYFDKGKLKHKKYVKKVMEVVRAGSKFLRKCVDRRGVIFNFILIIHLALAASVLISTCTYSIDNNPMDVKWIIPFVLRSLLIFWIMFLLWVFCIYRKTVKCKK
ncbi:Plasmodium exported protein (Pm-fam-a like), unknown function [Plasmodium malariae]|uniref:Uncharacterized protein n=1 Tax=Plasmodium malariae TaxID=5858 RepID=A0A1A8X1K7_PLAMA|nr:Plasmodium exported protein (Pm-fam-a like), unknown function [Plasmodium malariae]